MRSRLPGDAGRARVAALLAALAALALLGVLLSDHTPADDAYIYLRYVDNLLRGYGLTWNKGGERVEGYTSFLYTMLLVVPRAAGAPGMRAAQVINTGCFMATTTVVGLLSRAIVGRWSAAALVAPLLVATSATLAAASQNGMESMLLLVLLALALWTHLRLDDTGGGAALSGVLFGLAALTRPEAILVYASCAGHRAWERRRAGRPMIDRAEVVRAATVAGIVLPHLLFRRAYYGDWLPNTYYAKMAPIRLWRLLAGLKGMVAMLRGAPSGAVLLAALGLWLLAPRRLAEDLLVVSIGVFCAYLIRCSMSDWLLWYSAPVHLLAAMLAGLALAGILGDGGEVDRGRRRRAALGLVLMTAGAAATVHRSTPARLDFVDQGARVALLLVIAAASGAIVAGRTLSARARTTFVGGTAGALVAYQAVAAVELREHLAPDFMPTALKIAEIVQPGETLAIGAVGAVGYVTDAIVYDTLGLNDRHIGRSPSGPGPLYGIFGHEKGDGRYILDLRPTYLFPSAWPAEPIPPDGKPEKVFAESVLVQHIAVTSGSRHRYSEKTFMELGAIPELRELYEPVSVPLSSPPGTYLHYLRRKAPVSGGPSGEAR